MAGVNKVILLGNLGSDPEVRYFDSGSVVAKFNIATSERYKDKAGNIVEQTEWHRIELWDNLAKIAEQYLRKGNSVYVEGKIKTEEWLDKDGIQRKGITIRCNNMTLVGGSGNKNEDGGTQAAARPAPVTANTPPPVALETVTEGDDLPF